MMHSGKLCRRFVSGSTLLGCALVFGSAGLITGCGDSDKSGGQVETTVDPAKKAKDSMDLYTKNSMPKAKKAPNR